MEKNRLELDLAFGIEVCVCQWIKVVLGNALVELVVLLLGDVLLGTQPDGFLSVHLLPLEHSFLLWLLLFIILCLDIILLLLIFFLFIVIVIFVSIDVHL